MGLDGDPELHDTEESLVRALWTELTSSWINMIMASMIVYLLYKIFFGGPDYPSGAEPVKPPPPPLKKQDMTLAQLKKYDGKSRESGGRICVAVNGKIFDVSRGARFYGPEGPYSGFAGRDASRGLATFSVDPVSDDYDDLSDLKPSELEQVKEWELQFSEKYDLVGKLIREGDQAASYSEDESEATDNEQDKKDK